MQIRTFQPSDLDFAASCTQAEGWSSETREEFAGFLAHDPGGCFLAERDGKPIGICIATHYGALGFIGEFIVIPGERNKGQGHRLLEHAIAYLHKRGAQTVLLDADLAAISLYKRVGFQEVCPSLRFTGTVPGRAYPTVRPMQREDLGRLCALDRESFGADRSFFLARRLQYFPQYCKVMEQEQEIMGFIMGRMGNGIVSAGPWVVRDQADNPRALLEALACETGETPIRIGVLEIHTPAVRILQSYEELSASGLCLRMALGPSSQLGAGRGCYAIGNPSKG